ncbi:DUF1328 domain-containing protein [Methylobacterium indicum]|uniref:DUF1328 domain-containing protein n=1 Tax=Methylobacterium indicum TaxID=1775910 RepID=UPI000F780985|nr:DUF1328 domain-containing protein [Methylobacterium indicum]
MVRVARTATGFHPKKSTEPVAPSVSFSFNLLQRFTARRREAIQQPLIREFPMIGWAITFLVVALVAALLGFGGIAGTAMEAAKIVFFVAIVLFAVSAIFGLMRGRSPRI